MPAPKPASAPVDTASLSDAELFTYWKKRAIADDLAFFLRLELSPGLRRRAEMAEFVGPTKEAIAVLRAEWRTERNAADRAAGIPAIGNYLDPDGKASDLDRYSAIVGLPVTTTQELAS